MMNVSSALGLVSFVGAIVLTLARGLWLIARIEEQVKKQSEDLADARREFHDHVESNHLHRNPDSEARLQRMETTLDAVQTTVNDIRAALPR